MPTMKLVSQKRYGTIFKLTFLLNKYSHNHDAVCDIDGYAVVYFTNKHYCRNNEYTTNITMYFKKHESAKDVMVTLMTAKVTGTSSLTLEKLRLSCKESWRCHVIDTKPFTFGAKLFRLGIWLKISKPKDNIRNKLYNDDQFTDFKLCTEDGSIGIHKSILAVHNDMFNTMLGGKWKETEEKIIKIRDVTKLTLQHFKDYVYLGIVPEDILHLRSLLLLSKYYLMDDLEAKCSMKLIHFVTPENFVELLDFSRENNLLKLTFDLLRLTPEKVVQSAYNLESEKYLS